VIIKVTKKAAASISRLQAEVISSEKKQEKLDF
jgi:hypothetical protein